jgi:hypothetical protein
MARKLLAIVLAGLFVASAASTALAHCGGWLPLAADRHACCRGGQMASTTRATACCAMSEQADDTAPTEARVGTPPPTVARHVAPAALAAVATDAFLAARSADHPAASGFVPLYLRQLSLLI